jgi:flagellar protein FliS
MNEKLESYKVTEVAGRSGLDLLIQVYEGTIRAFVDARQYYESGKSAQGYEQMERARRFITHLYTTLDFEQGGDIATNLSKLYVHLLNEISVIEAVKDVRQIDDNVRVLSNLRDGWIGIRPAPRKNRETMATAEPASSEAAFVTSA